jgi:ATP-dependent helicase/nuclease subunit A
VAGRVDRIAIAGERVLIVDYKTNRPSPVALADVPRDYVAQLAVYRRALSGLHPGRAVAAALLWTDGPRLMEIPGAALDAAEKLIFGGGKALP